MDIVYFLKKNRALLAIITVLILGIIAFFLMTPKIEEEFIVKKSFTLNFPERIAKKDILISNTQNLQSFSYFNKENSQIYSAIIKVPDALSQNLKGITLSETDGLKLEPNKNMLLFSGNEISLGFERKNVDACIIVIIIPKEWLNALEETEKEELLETISELDSGLNCEETGILESQISENIYQAFDAG
jgi:hypothetical protein